MSSDRDRLGLRRRSNPAEALADVMNGTVIAMLAIIVALILTVLVLIMANAVKGRALEAKELEIVAKEEALRIETEARSQAETDLAASEQQKARLARLEAEAKQKALEEMAKAEEAAAKSTKTKKALEEMARQSLTDGQIDALASLEDLRRQVKKTQEMNAELREEVRRLSQELTESEHSALEAERHARESQSQAREAMEALEECNQAQGGDPDGKLVNSGLKIVEFPDGHPGKLYLIRSADYEAEKDEVHVQYMCSKNSDVPIIYFNGYGGSGRIGGSVGR